MWLLTVDEFMATKIGWNKTDNPSNRAGAWFYDGEDPLVGLELLLRYQEQFNTWPLRGGREYPRVIIEYRLLSVSQLPVTQNSTFPLKELGVRELSEGAIQKLLDNLR